MPPNASEAQPASRLSSDGTFTESYLFPDALTYDQIVDLLMVTIPDNVTLEQRILVRQLIERNVDLFSRHEYDIT